MPVAFRAAGDRDGAGAGRRGRPSTDDRWFEGLFAVTSEEVRQQAQAEGLVLRVADNKTGYFGVYLEKPGQPKPSRRW